MGGKPRRRYLDATTGQTRAVGYGYVGRWSDGTIGWSLPSFITGSRERAQVPRVTDWNTGEPLELCRITVEVVPGARRLKLKGPPDAS